MKFLSLTLSIFIIAVKRLLAQTWLALASTLGLVIAISLTISVPMYADAIYHSIFLGDVANTNQLSTNTRPPFSFLFRYFGSITGNIEWEKFEPLVEVINTRIVEKTIGLPQKVSVHYVSSDPYQLFPGTFNNYSDPGKPIQWIPFSYLSDLENHVFMLEGTFPKAAEPDETSEVEAMVSLKLAEKYGIQTGENYVLLLQYKSPDGKRLTTPLKIRISGVWTAKNPKDEYWFLNPNFIEEHLLVNPLSFSNRIAPYMYGEVYVALWYVLVDGSSVTYKDAGLLIQKIDLLRNEVDRILPDTSLWQSPAENLAKYQQTSSTLTILLYVFNIPILGLLLAFIIMTSGLTIERQRNEIAVLRSRGAFVSQLISINLVESIILSGIALILSYPIGGVVAWLVSQTKGFLEFESLPEVNLQPNSTSLEMAMVAVCISLVARIIPTLSAANNTIVTYKQERARQLKLPFWQRYGLDFFLLIPSLYGTYLLQQQGRIALLGSDVGGDPFQNPLFFLIPSFAVLSISLIFLRFLPVGMRFITWIFSTSKSVGLLMAARHLARTPGAYTIPLLLLIMTLSLSTFTASLAQTLDRHLIDQMNYKIGADMTFSDLGEEKEPVDLSLSGNRSQATPPNASSPEISFLFLPVTDYLTIPDVQSVTRVGVYNATARVPKGQQKAIFMGVDRVSFPQVAKWRRDFANENLGTLMNRLATTENGILVQSDFLYQNNLSLSDTIRLSVTTYGLTVNIDCKIVGLFDLFPSWYPQNGPLFVGNLDYLFEQTGGMYPYNVWVKLSPTASFVTIEQSLRTKGIRILGWAAPKPLIKAEQQKPSRQGLFGMLTIGFIASAIVTVVGFFLYALFSFRRRFVELGVLRAVGLSIGQMASILSWELAFLILIGGGLGTGLGVLISEIYIPFLQIGVDPSSLIPPYVVQISWEAISRIYVIFGTFFVIALLSLVVLLRRMKIFQAIKLGETI